MRTGGNDQPLSSYFARVVNDWNNLNLLRRISFPIWDSEVKPLRYGDLPVELNDWPESTKVDELKVASRTALLLPFLPITYGFQLYKS